MGRRAKPAKVKGQGKRLPARKVPKTDDARVRALETRLAEAVKGKAEAEEQQTATSEILKVISTSPTDLQPVFQAIVDSAVQLCHAQLGAMYHFDGQFIHFGAHHGFSMSALNLLRDVYPGPASLDALVGRTVLQKCVVHVPNYQLTDDIPVLSRRLAELIGNRSILLVPMVRQDSPIGAIAIGRAVPGAFTDRQIELLKTFADQAVIAMENVRLFTETKEALEQQAATSEILRVISSSPTDYQPVFDSIVRNAGSVCAARDALLLLVDGDELVNRAHHGDLETAPIGSCQPIGGTVAGRAVNDACAVHVEDLLTATEFPVGRELCLKFGHRTIVSVPLLRGGEAIGAIMVRRGEVRRFTDKQVGLLQTFADQAVIAIENVRLFTELREKNRALAQAHAQVTEALEQRTATSEILGVIASSPTDVQPVFDTVIRSAIRLARGDYGGISLLRDDMFHLAASEGLLDGLAAFQRVYPLRLDQSGLMNIAVTTRSPVHTANVFDDPRVGPFAHQMASAAGYSAFIHVPLARHDTVIGLLTVNRREAGPFAPGEIGLLQTFADQAVIAIENVRLFNETREALEQQEASAEVLAVISSSVEDTAPVFERIMDSCEKVTAFTRMAIFLRGDDDQVNLAAYRDRGPGGEAVAAALRATFPQPLANTPMALAFVQQRALFFGDVLNDPQAPASLRLAATRMGNFSVLVAPMLWEGRGIGAFHVGREAHETFSDKEVALLKTFTDQAVIAIQNARLFQEIADKSQQLEAASQHKSEFLANMSHELRTPLNAILGFSEVLAQGMFGAVNEKQIEYLHDILESGRHLLSLINDILDLSKIEAGRMELEVSEFDLPQAIQNALTLVRERALRRGIGLHHAIDSQVAAIRADERKVKQVLLNLLSNAIKFTPEGGRIEVRATPADGLVEVSVADTGVGIAPEDLEAVFEEFRQVGTADKKAEGTGLGLALAKKFVELHGGRIWVESAPGRGSTFTFMLPIQ